MGSSIEDIEFLARSAYREDALRALASGPCDRDTLLDETGASKSTIARLLNEFEERNWVARDEYRYELTDPGRFVAERFIGLVDTIETERSLRDVWQYLPTDLPGFTISLFEDAVITFPTAHSPYKMLPQFAENFESARTMRGFSEQSPKPGSLELIMRNAAAGVDTEVIFSPAVIYEIRTEISDAVIERAIDGGYLTVLVRDTFPTNACLELFDDRFALYCRDDMGVTRVGIDTESAKTIAWGKSIYDDVRSGARPVDLLEREIA